MPGVTRDRVELETTWRGPNPQARRHGRVRARGEGDRSARLRSGERAAARADVVLLVVDVQTGPVEEDASSPGGSARRRCRSSSSSTRSTPSGTRRGVSLPTRSGSGTRSRSPPCTAGARATCSTRSSPSCPRRGRRAEEPEEPRVRDRRPAERRQVEPVQPAGGGGALGGVRGGRHDPGRRRRARRLAGRPVRFVDTAGFRRPSKVQGVEYYSFLRAERAIERAHVALLVLDASEGFAGEDKRIAARVMEVGRGLVVVANKWDLVEERDRAFKGLTELLAPYARRPCCGPRRSADGVHRLPAVLPQVHDAVEPPRPDGQGERGRRGRAGRAAGPGRHPVPVRHQVAGGPPRFVLFGAAARGELPAVPRRPAAPGPAIWTGVPIVMRFRQAGRAASAAAAGYRCDG